MPWTVMKICTTKPAMNGEFEYGRFSEDYSAGEERSSSP